MLTSLPWEPNVHIGATRDQVQMCIRDRIDAGRFEVKTSEATISVPPERSYLVQTRIIDGRRYLLVPAEDAVEINGAPVRLPRD